MNDRFIQYQIRVLLLGSCLAGMPACSGKALILDAGPNSTAVNTVDGGTVETVRLHDPIDAFWVDDARLYWTDQSQQLRSCRHDDCEHTTISYGSTSYPESVALGTNDVFWLLKGSGSTVITCLKAGCTSAPTRVVRDTYLHTVPLVADGDYFYWASAFDIYRCPSSGCGDIPEVVALGEVTNDLRISDSFAYWPRWNGVEDNGHLKPPVEIRRAPKDGSEPATTVLTIPISGDSWAGFAVDARTLYWFDDSYHVQSCPLESCNSQPPTVLVTTDANKYSLRVDEMGLYWEEHAANVISMLVKYCPLSGCVSEPQTLSGELFNLFALDSKYLYWYGVQTLNNGTEFTGDRSIHRVPKPTP